MTKQRIHLTPAEAAEKGLRCRSYLKALRLMPAPDARPAGTVWQGQGAYNVYSVEDCVPWRWAPGPAQRRRQSVSAQAQGLIDQQCVVMDTESTGLGSNDEVCEIAIVDIDGNPLLDTLIRPNKPIPKEATAIHGITDAMAANAPSWPDIAEQFATVVRGRTVVTYNAAFDERLIRQTHQLHGLPAPALTTACLMRMFATWNGEWDKGHEISWMDLSYDEGQMHPPSVMGSTKISEFLEEPDQKFILVYDFMRMWIFLIELISTNEESVVAPATVLAIGDSPDEHSKQATNMDFEDDFIDEEEEEDDFGFDDYDNGIDEDEIGGFDEYEY